MPVHAWPTYYGVMHAWHASLAQLVLGDAEDDGGKENVAEAAPAKAQKEKPVSVRPCTSR